MQYFQPKRVFYEQKALDYPMGDRLYNQFKREGVPLEEVRSHQEVPPLDYNKAKETLVIGTKKDLRFLSCKPSAHYRLVFSSSCPHGCHYCYLATGLGPKIYLRIYVNIRELMEKTREYIEKRRPQITSFEASSSSDPLAVEHLTRALETFIPFFSKNPSGRLRIATKCTNIDSLLSLEHGGKTHIRFSINTPHVIHHFEENTPSLQERMVQSKRLADSGYRTGFILAPIILYPHWKREYEDLLEELASTFKEETSLPPSFEIIMLRLTKRACKIIEDRFPYSTLDMDLSSREHKGFGKYVYPEERAQEIKTFFEKKIREYFPLSSLEYFT